MSKQFDHHDLVLVPLTPIHIGGGDEAILGLEDYRLKNGFLQRTDLKQFIHSSPDIEQILSDLERNFQSTFLRLQDDVPDQAITERIPASSEVCSILERQIEDAKRSKPKNRGTIHAFIRAGRTPMLPGSSLKGCIRTAWLAKCVRQRGIQQKGIHGRDSGDQSKKLMQMAFDMSSNETAGDPLRDVTVGDANLPEGATKVDRVSSWKKDRSGKKYAADPSGGYQLMRERLLAVTDGGRPPIVDVRIGLRRDGVRSLRRKTQRDGSYPHSSPASIPELLSALNEHHSPIWKWELQKFFADTSEKLLSQALGLFDGIARSGEQISGALVRIGWATHAEAKSIEGFRKIQRPQFRGQQGEFAKSGATRHVIDDSGVPCPFGWALLITSEAWHARKDSIGWLPKQKRSTGKGGLQPGGQQGPGRDAAPRFRKGSRVALTDGSTANLLENIRDGQKEVQAEIDGDIDTIRVSEIKGPL